MKIFKIISIFLAFSLGTLAFSAGPSRRIPASTAKIVINCTQPKKFTGLSANVTGILKLSPLPHGAAQATGTLEISLFNPRSVWSGKRKVMGQYDDLSSVESDEYFHGGARIKNDDDIMEIYVNYTRPEMSSIEYRGSVYKMACK